MSFLSFIKSVFFQQSFPARTEFLFIGLGNPGEKYHKTRHNIGFRVADAFSRTLSQTECGYRYETDYCVSESDAVVVAKPKTFMNRSGDAVTSLMETLGVPVTSVMIIVDDFNIPLGRIRMRSGGSDGGHNGLKSISARIGTGYPRLRIGIGPLPEGMDIVNYVLGEFSDKEEEQLQEVIPRAVSALKLYMADGVSAVMNKYNA